MREVASAIEEFDGWMLQETDLSSVSKISELGFKQLNDLLLYKWVPEYRNWVVRDYSDRDDGRILEYEVVSARSSIGHLDAPRYLATVQNRLSELPSPDALVQCDPSLREVVLQDLITVAFAVERWGQALLHHDPGTTVRQLRVSAADISLHDYLTKEVGNYNTLGCFALRSTSLTHGVRVPQVNSDIGQPPVTFEFKDSYSGYDGHSSKPASRLPSILELDSFLGLMKKGELASCAYNHSLLRMLEAIQTGGLSGQQALVHARSATLLFASMSAAFRDFFGYRGFSEAKFIYLMRQMTVELSLSPAALLLKGLDLSSAEKIKYKAFLDHYLIRTRLTGPECRLFVLEVLRNEGLGNDRIDRLSFAHLVQNQPGAQKELLSEIEAVCSGGDRQLLVRMLTEMIKTRALGLNRLKYTLHLFARFSPEHAQQFSQRMDDDAWLEGCLSAIMASDYQVAPSGANSVAFFGPDWVLGYQSDVANYRIHMLNRLPVMQPVDQEYFWRYQSLGTSGVSPKWEDWINDALTDRSHLGESELTSATPEQITEALLRQPWLSVYVDLFDWYARLATSHNGSVQKYVRNVAKTMPETDKAKLTSRPDHGTTFMNPDRDVPSTEAVFDLPSIHSLTSIRKNFLLKDWIQPLAALRASGRLNEYPDPSVTLSEVGTQAYFY